MHTWGNNRRSYGRHTFSSHSSSSFRGYGWTSAPTTSVSASGGYESGGLLTLHASLCCVAQACFFYAMPSKVVGLTTMVRLCSFRGYEARLFAHSACLASFSVPPLPHSCSFWVQGEEYRQHLLHERGAAEPAEPAHVHRGLDQSNIDRAADRGGHTHTVCGFCLVTDRLRVLLLTVPSRSPALCSACLPYEWYGFEKRSCLVLSLCRPRCCGRPALCPL